MLTLRSLGLFCLGDLTLIAKQISWTAAMKNRRAIGMIDTTTIPSFSRFVCLSLGLACSAVSLSSLQAEKVDLYLLGGQSNMEGQGSIKQLKEEQKKFSKPVHFWNGKAWENLKVGQTRTSNKPDRFGLEISFAQEMAKLGENVYMVKHSASGMPLHHGWHRNTWKGGEPEAGRVNFYPGIKKNDPKQGSLYKIMLKRYQDSIAALKKQGHTPVVRGFLWMQGEQDSKNELSATVYGECLKRLRDRLAEDLGVEKLPIIYGQVLAYEPALERFTHRKEIREVMAQSDSTSGHAKALKDAFMVATEGCSLKKDTVHYDTAGYLQLGRKFAERLQKARGGK